MPSILVVDDEPAVRSALTEMLEDQGHLVADFGTAAEAIAFCNVPANEVLAVFTDINTPGDVNGLDLVRHVRRTRPHVPVVVTSGEVGGLPTEFSRSVRFLAKPWTEMAVLKAIGVPAP